MKKLLSRVRLFGAERLDARDAVGAAQEAGARAGRGAGRIRCGYSASARGSSVRERMSSLRYAWPRCISTVLTVTNNAWAMAGLERPPAAIWHMRFSLGVSDSCPWRSVRGT